MLVLSAVKPRWTTSRPEGRHVVVGLERRRAQHVAQAGARGAAVRPVEPHPVAQRPAEQLVDGDAEGLGLDVPERQLDAGDGLVGDPAEVLAGAAQHVPVQALDGARILADEEILHVPDAAGDAEAGSGCRCTRPSPPGRRRSRCGRRSTAASRRRSAWSPRARSSRDDLHGGPRARARAPVPGRPSPISGFSASARERPTCSPAARISPQVVASTAMPVAEPLGPGRALGVAGDEDGRARAWPAARP